MTTPPTLRPSRTLGTQPRTRARNKNALMSCTFARTRHATPHHNTTRHTTPCSVHHILSCFATLCHATPRHATPRPALSRHATPRHATPRDALIDRRMHERTYARAHMRNMHAQPHVCASMGTHRHAHAHNGHWFGRVHR